DEDELLSVARHLDTVNLPDDRGAIREIIDLSQRSFAGEVKDPKKREYVFVLLDLAKKTVVGTSMIIAQLGRRDAPYIYFDVADEQKYSQTLDKHFTHTLLRIGYSYNGPTEIGGLIVRPEYRKAPERLGQLISYVRFLFIATHRSLFRDQLLAELLPPLESDGTSHLWEALGRHFTGLSYAEADFLSKKNKEFIKSLFPDSGVYASLLPQDAQDVVGKVGLQTRGVEKLLKRIGFRYASRIDPFDGGPHFTASTDEVTLIARTKKVEIAHIVDAPRSGPAPRHLCARELETSPFIRVVIGAVTDVGGGGVALEAHVARHLGVERGDEIVVLPVD
ncbi:MAG TPA: arginine N-succinyltransferase, partial [Polyangiaceae bacterium]|nr:arginine N-succinyltransferase [Polyangiaceae bacterium]